MRVNYQLPHLLKAARNSIKPIPEAVEADTETRDQSRVRAKDAEESNSFWSFIDAALGAVAP